MNGSSITSNNLKARLYAEGLKQPTCEICSQGEQWRGRWMSLILDHINGVRSDNRLENLRIACPNCNATLDTHCGRQTRIVREPRNCERCGTAFVPRYSTQRHCSQGCGTRWDRSGIDWTELRRVERPPLEGVITEATTIGYEAAGRAYGVSGTAIRKWIRDYGAEPPPGGGRRRSPGQSKRKWAPTGPAPDAAARGTAAARVDAKTPVLAPISRIRSSTGVGCAETPLA